MRGFGELRQRDAYLAGARGQLSAIPLGAALEERARKSMSTRAFAYVAGGAGLESTMAANRAAFERVRIVPRILRDVSVRDTSVSLFDSALPTPLLFAPVGALELVHREADLAVARAAAAEGVPMIFSNQASVSMEKCAAVMGDSPRWFQLYWSTSNELVESLVRRAEAAGCGAIVATLDTTLLGWRPRDLELGYLPFIEGKGLAQYTSDPVFTRLVDQALEMAAAPPLGPPSLAGLSTLFSLARSYPGSLLRNLRSPRPRAAVQVFADIYSRPSLTWSDLAFLRELTSLPILLKGVLHPDDARAALEHGVDGLVVSTHGGRQVDGAVGSLDALPGVVEAVGGRVPVLLDSGVRSGVDVFKALALGATAVLVGRPYVYGLAIAGEQGVREVLRNLAADFDLTLGLTGCTSATELSPDCLAHA
jgi:lactate 2-monooxygenase